METRTFRIMHGTHTQGTGEDLTTYKARDRKGQLIKGFSDVIKTEKPLDKLFGADKFRPIMETPEGDFLTVPSEATKTEKEDDWAEYTVAELKVYATEESIDIRGCLTKSEIIEAIKHASV